MIANHTANVAFAPPAPRLKKTRPTKLDSFRAAVPALPEKLLTPLARPLAAVHEHGWLKRSAHRPVIGIPCTHLQAIMGPMGSLASYVNAILDAGGQPRLMLPSRGTIEKQMHQIDGLLIPGGYDIDPATYRAVKGPGMADRTILPRLDRFSIACIQMGYGTSLPMLGICKGMQLMSVALGGKLTQDIATEHPGANDSVSHRAIAVPRSSHWPLKLLKQSGPDAEHPIQVVGGSRLEQLLGKTPLTGNSAHHQCLRDVPADLVATATAPDGVVEGIERRGAPHQLGVQGHPERFRRKEPRYHALFEDLVKNAALRKVADAAGESG